MNFEVLGVDQEEKRVSVRVGPIKLQCKILENGSNPHIIKPPILLSRMKASIHPFIESSEVLCFLFILSPLMDLKWGEKLSFTERTTDSGAEGPCSSHGGGTDFLCPTVKRRPRCVFLVNFLDLRSQISRIAIRPCQVTGDFKNLQSPKILD